MRRPGCTLTHLNTHIVKLTFLAWQYSLSAIRPNAKSLETKQVTEIVWKVVRRSKVLWFGNPADKVDYLSENAESRHAKTNTKGHKAIFSICYCD